MTQPNPQLPPAVRQAHIAPCFHCRQSFDLMSAALCGCTARERTRHCGSCACDTQNSFRWRKRKELSDGIARLQSLDPALPRALRALGFATLTNSNPEEAHSIATAILADEYLEKPILPGTLSEAIDRLMPEVARAHPHSKDVRSAS